MGTCMSNNCQGNDLIGKAVMKQECCCIDNHGIAGWIDNEKEVCERCPSQSKKPGECGRNLFNLVRFKIF